ncbi:MAG: aspartate kinase [Polyangiaceae bacterium]|jgi:aspartate kinase|nr:aspartate kinase [Polyangiaceae bacterium]
MGIVVQKYGGSSVADVDKIRKVADKVAATYRAGNKVVVVVSAMAKATDSLLELANQAAGIDGVPPAPPRRELDMLVTTGERVSMALLSIAIHARGLDGISFTGSQCGIMTNARHFNARIIEVRPHRIEDELAKGRIVIVAGYQGVSYEREITTLGRGGSDTTAVALAAALDADRCEIYSDVDGVYSADPRVVSDAQHIPILDPEVLQEMAECGAKVLNAQAVEWARRAGIAIYARSTFAPADAAGQPLRETVVRKFAPNEDNRVRAIVGRSDAAWVRLDSDDPVDIDHACAALERADIPMTDLALCARGGSFLVPMLSVPDWARAEATLRESEPWRKAHIHRDVAVISVVGHGLADDAVPTRRMLTALRSEGVRPFEVRAAPLRLTAVVRKGVCDSAQRALHRAFLV